MDTKPTLPFGETKLSNLPDEMKQTEQWVYYRLQQIAGRSKPAKMPYSPNGSKWQKADTTDPKTWGTFEQAVAACSMYEGTGIGFVFSKDDPYVGIDLDGCIDRETGAIEEWAEEIISRVDTYTELSPSGTGVHLFVRGWLGDGRNRRGGIELYEQGRFFTVTGQMLAGCPSSIENRQAELMGLQAQITEVVRPRNATAGSTIATNATVPTDKVKSPAKSDEQVLTLARNSRYAAEFVRLWAGTIEAGRSSSEAEYHLCRHLARHTTDREQIDRLVRRSGLCRDKWLDRRDYRSRTIENAIANVRNATKQNDVNTASPDIAAQPEFPSNEERSNEPAKTPGPTEAAAEPERRTSGISSVNPVGEEWPDPPGEAAYYGITGKFVELAGAHTEADPAALAVTLLTAFGGAIGEGPYTLVGATKHSPRIFTTLVGKSSKARKGESLSPVRALLSTADADWSSRRILNGLSSGEGLITAVRDRVEKTQPVKGTAGAYETVVVDEGVDDKRLLVVEPEFARVLQVMQRQGNSLNSVLRDAWDRGDLGVITKSPVRATGAQITILGHITVEELRRELTETDSANGFANRFIWLAVRRAREIPRPKPFEGPAVDAMALELADTLDYARAVRMMDFDAEADELWREIYHDLSAEKEGLFGAIVGRAEAQVLRLSMLYALLDRSSTIRAQHLVSALELWGYAERSALHIFGGATGNPVADTIYRNLKERGPLRRTELSRLFSNHVPAERIEAALLTLVEGGKARTETLGSGGRPVEMWSAV